MASDLRITEYRMEMKCPRCGCLFRKEEVEGTTVGPDSNPDSICKQCLDKEYEAATELAMEWAE